MEKEAVGDEPTGRRKQAPRIRQAFIDVGGVLGGNRTPGMILAAKALRDGNPHPARPELLRAIRENLCRRTGDIKIAETRGFG